MSHNEDVDQRRQYAKMVHHQGVKVSIETSCGTPVSRLKATRAVRGTIKWRPTSSEEMSICCQSK